MKLFSYLALVGCLIGFISKPAYGQDKPPIVILIGIDGMRADTLERYHLANLQALADTGIATSMQPVMPSKTFVNFYSIATGLYPEQHGMTSNKPYDRKLQRTFNNRLDDTDPRWWAGEPIWITAEKQGVKAATYFWVGSEVKIDGVSPSFVKPYDQNKDYAQRVSEVLHWMSLPSEQRPQLVTLYFSSVDSASHDYGVGSKQEYQALLDLDQHIATLRQGIADLGLAEQVNFIVVSDHGMVNLADEKVINLTEKVDFSQLIVPAWSNRNKAIYEPFVYVYAEPQQVENVYAKVKNLHPNLKAYKRGEMPKHYRLDHPQRGPDLMLLADPGWSIYLSNTAAKPQPISVTGRARATHGYDNQHPLMQAIFIAAGPAFKSLEQTPPIKNLAVYGLVACLLELKPAKNEASVSSIEKLLVKDCEPTT
ncbi:alkaline phosphatase family protein [Paraglaciecola aestuariivivens]